jgi:hypothetical protein
VSKSYPIVAVFWEDHAHYERSPILKPSQVIPTPTLSVGILYDEDDRVMIIVSDIERYDDRDEATFMAILKSTVVATKTFGKVKLRSLR